MANSSHGPGDIFPGVSSSSAELQALAQQVAACRLCAGDFAATHTAHAPRPVMHPSTTARICVAGQAPGARVHASGRPFDDPSGDRLRAWMGVDRDVFWDARKVAILPMAFCFPGYDAKSADLPPPKRCAETWRADLFAAQPQFELILLVGGYAQKWHLGPAAGRSLTATVARWREFFDPAAPGALRCFPTPHPSWRNNAWLKKNPWFEEEAIPCLQAEVTRLLEPPQG